jgi:very-short-patch-repair endonuclease
MRLHYDANLKERSRKLRKQRVLSEVLLWNQLKQRILLGCQFARQKPILHYIVDFYCSKLGLVIEIDGESHYERFVEDLKRQQDLENHGSKVLRFHDRDVKENLENVLRQIQNWIEHVG